ncbi:MAG: MATE family efflux transporter [Oscillospiraceae bacterium]|nr:MATE family efflux transporter [Oscillospiraceae bacterium]
MKPLVSLRSRPQQSMTEGPIWKGLIYFAIPIFFGNLFQQLYNTADTLIVGNFLGKEALAAVSSSGNLIFMMVGFLHGMAMGAGVLIAKHYGAKDYKRMRTAIHTDIAFALIAGIALTVVGVLLTPHILRWMGTPENVLPNSIAYFRTYFLGSCASFLYNVCTGILQAVGNSRHPLYYLMISSCINVALDILFVGVFRWGVASAALATVISQVISAALCLRQLLTTREVYRVSVREIRLNLSVLRQIVSFGLPAGVQNSVIAFANVLVQTNINAFGDSAMAGCGSYSKLEGFAFLPVTCFSMALSTFVSQNLGAKQHDRVKRGAKLGIICAMVTAELVGIVLWLFAPVCISLFNGDPEVIQYGVMQARVISLFFCMLALNHCIAGILRGAGKATVPMVVMLLSWCLLRVTYITIMVRVFRHIAVIFTAYPLTWTVSGIIFLIYYFKVDWVHHFDRLDEQRQKV